MEEEYLSKQPQPRELVIFICNSETDGFNEGDGDLMNQILIQFNAKGIKAIRIIMYKQDVPKNEKWQSYLQRGLIRCLREKREPYSKTNPYDIKNYQDDFKKIISATEFQNCLKIIYIGSRLDCEEKDNLSSKSKTLVLKQSGALFDEKLMQDLKAKGIKTVICCLEFKFFMRSKSSLRSGFEMLKQQLFLADRIHFLTEEDRNYFKKVLEDLQKNGILRPLNTKDLSFDGNISFENARQTVLLADQNKPEKEEIVDENLYSNQLDRLLARAKIESVSKQSNNVIFTEVEDAKNFVQALYNIGIRNRGMPNEQRKIQIIWKNENEQQYFIIELITDELIKLTSDTLVVNKRIEDFPDLRLTKKEEEIFDFKNTAFAEKIKDPDWIKALIDKAFYFPGIYTVEPFSIENELEYIDIPGLIFQEIPGDGHCLFHAVALYLGEDVSTLRRKVAQYLRENVNSFVDIITALNSEKTVEQYIEAVKKGVEWADDLEIAILMKILKRAIIIIDPDKRIRNPSVLSMPGTPIFVYYNGYNHYDALLLDSTKSEEEIIKNVQQSVSPVNRISSDKKDIEKMTCLNHCNQFLEKATIKPVNDELNNVISIEEKDAKEFIKALYLHMPKQSRNIHVIESKTVPKRWIVELPTIELKSIVSPPLLGSAHNTDSKIGSIENFVKKLSTRQKNIIQFGMIRAEKGIDESLELSKILKEKGYGNLFIVGRVRELAILRHLITSCFVCYKEEKYFEHRKREFKLNINKQEIEGALEEIKNNIKSQPFDPDNENQFYLFKFKNTWYLYGRYNVKTDVFESLDSMQGSKKIIEILQKEKMDSNDDYIVKKIIIDHYHVKNEFSERVMIKKDLFINALKYAFEQLKAKHSEENLQEPNFKMLADTAWNILSGLGIDAFNEFAEYIMEYCEAHFEKKLENIKIYFNMDAETLKGIAKTSIVAIKLDHKGMAENASSIVSMLGLFLPVITMQGYLTSEKFHKGGKYEKTIICPEAKYTFYIDEKHGIKEIRPVQPTVNEIVDLFIKKRYII